MCWDTPFGHIVIVCVGVERISNTTEVHGAWVREAAGTVNIRLYMEKLGGNMGVQIRPQRGKWGELSFTLQNSRWFRLYRRSMPITRKYMSSSIVSITK